MEINDELMIPCAQCCRKHLSAAIAHYADSNANRWSVINYREVLVARLRRATTAIGRLR